MTKRILSAVLTLCMVLGTMSFSVMAATVTASNADDFYAAVRDAQPGDIINLEASVEYDVWNSIWNKDGIKINGNGNTVTVGAVFSNINGGGLLLNASNLTINDLNVVLPADATGEMERLATMKSGTLNNVSVIGGAHAVSVIGEGAVVINNCDFSGIEGWAIETESRSTSENASLTISSSTFDEEAVIIRGQNTVFTGNTIEQAGEGVNVLGNAVISGNDFGESTLGIDRGIEVTIEKNTINNVEFSEWLAGDYSNVTVENNTLSNEVVAEMNDKLEDEVVSVDPAVTVGGKGYYTIADAIAEANDGDVIEIAAGTYEEGVINFPKVLKNVTIKGADNKTTILKNSSLQNMALPGGWSDPKFESEYHGITIDGIVFDNSFIQFTGWANNALNQSVSYKDWTITNCEFKNVEGAAAVYFNLAESEQMENVTFTNNIIDGVLTTNMSGFGINAVKGNVVITGNNIKNVAFNSIQIQNSPADATVTIKNNVLNSNKPLINVNNIIGATEVNDNVFIAPSTDSYYMSHISTEIDTSANFFGTGTSVDDAVFNENYAAKLHTSGDGKAVTYTHYTDAAKTELVNLAVAKVDGVDYLTIAEAVANANPGGVIDLMGKTLDLPEGASLNITKDLTIQNGTIDIANGVWNGNSIIEIHGGSDADFVELTMNNVDVTGDNYSSAFGVVYAYDYGKVILNNCNFELSNEQYTSGGVLKGNGVAQSEFVVKDSTFMLENPNRVITNATVAIENTTIDAKVTDDTLAVGDMNNHALRSVEGTVTNSTITIDGFESGIENSGGEALVVEDNSTVELTNSVDADVNLSGSATIALKDESKLIAVNYKDDASKDSVDDTDGIIVDKVAYLQEAPVAAVYVNTALSTASFTGGKVTVAADVYSAEMSGTWAFVDPTEVMTAIGTVQREAEFTPDDESYDTIEATVDVVVGYMPSRSPSSSGNGSTASYTVKFETNGGSEIKDVKVASGKTVTEPAAPEKENNVFAGWYADKNLTKEFDFDTKIKKATTIYAGWVEKIPANQIILRIDSKAADVFGERKGMDVAPQIVNQRTMLPTRFVAESLGATVEWDEETQTVTITKGETVIEIFIGKDYAKVNGKEVELDSPAFIENDRTYTPIRFISENLGAHVDWDGETKTVTITKIK